MIFCNVAGHRDVVGGLGNNLFKIAAAASLSYENNDELLVSDWRYNIFDEIKFGLSRDMIIIDYIYYESDFTYSEISYKKNMEIIGSFQSEKYFNKDYIRKIFTPKKQIVDYIKEKYREILNKNITSIHVRRGDYLTNIANHPVQSIKYYIEAMKVIGECDSFLVISDDIQWCKSQKIFSGNRFHFIENEKDYIDLFISSMCKNNIIANSTFSWWGAWLNCKKDKKVIAPKTWFGPNLTLDTKDVLPEEWIKI